MKKEIVPAIIAKSNEEMQEKILKVKDYTNIIQLDVMDGNFVPNESLNFDLDLPKILGQYEAHLMVADPLDWINKNSEKVSTIIFHFEPTNDPEHIINLIKQKNKKAAISINPETKVEKIIHLLDKLDQILVMTVDPGFYGSKFIPEMADKIKEIRKLMPNLDIEVDGGISPDTIKLVKDAGANMFVSGSYIIKSDDSEKNINTLKQLAN